MQCPLKNLGELSYNDCKCYEGECAWWVGGEQQECAIKNLAFHIRMINQNTREK